MTSPYTRGTYQKDNTSQIVGGSNFQAMLDRAEEDLRRDYYAIRRDLETARRSLQDGRFTPRTGDSSPNATAYASIIPDKRTSSSPLTTPRSTNSRYIDRMDPLPTATLSSGKKSHISMAILEDKKSNADVGRKSGHKTSYQTVSHSPLSSPRGRIPVEPILSYRRDNEHEHEHEDVDKQEGSLSPRKRLDEKRLQAVENLKAAYATANVQTVQPPKYSRTSLANIGALQSPDLNDWRYGRYFVEDGDVWGEKNDRDSGSQPFTATVIRSFTRIDPKSRFLPIKEGTRVVILDAPETPGWWFACYMGKTGLVPSSYVEREG
jgi:hypothetical protein